MKIDWDIIKTCSLLCIESYNKKEKPSGFTDIDDLRYGVRTVGDNVYIIFRGTNNIPNILRDLYVVTRKTPSGHLAHGGCVKAYRKLLASGLPILTGDNVYAIGHSFGGGLASIYAAHAKCKLITFGCLRTWSRFWHRPDIDHLRVVNDDDPVPMVPRVFFRPDCDPFVFTDPGLGIDIKDHYMVHYDAMVDYYSGRR